MSMNQFDPREDERDRWMRAQEIQVLRFRGKEMDLDYIPKAMRWQRNSVLQHPSPPAPLPQGERGARAGKGGKGAGRWKKMIALHATCHPAGVRAEFAPTIVTLTHFCPKCCEFFHNHRSYG